MDSLINTSNLSDIARACARLTPDQGIAALPTGLAGILSELEFRLVLSRSGWSRFGGIVDREYARVSDNLREWAERESEGDVLNLVARFGDKGYFATRLQGRTHYLVAPTGSGAADFVQLEVEELVEVLDRPLLEPDWIPDDLDDFLDPLDYPRLDPQPIAAPRYVFRRATPIAEWIASHRELTRERAPLQRFLRDWNESSAGVSSRLCEHWVLALRETPKSEGGAYISARPVPVESRLNGAAIPFDQVQGPDLANRIHAVDRDAGYPFAWYFSMLCSRKVAFETADAVYDDMLRGYDYLPARDLRVLRGWIEDRYAA